MCVCVSFLIYSDNVQFLYMQSFISPLLPFEFTAQTSDRQFSSLKWRTDLQSEPGSGLGLPVEISGKSRVEWESTARHFRDREAT